MANYVIVDQRDLARPKIHSRWSKITEEDVEQINGNHDRLIDLIERYYGISKVEAEDQLQGFLRAITSKVSRPASLHTRV